MTSTCCTSGFPSRGGCCNALRCAGPSKQSLTAFTTTSTASGVFGRGTSRIATSSPMKRRSRHTRRGDSSHILVGVPRECASTTIRGTPGWRGWMTIFSNSRGRNAQGSYIDSTAPGENCQSWIGNAVWMASPGPWSRAKKNQKLANGGNVQTHVYILVEIVL